MSSLILPSPSNPPLVAASALPALSSQVPLLAMSSIPLSSARPRRHSFPYSAKILPALSLPLLSSRAALSSIMYPSLAATLFLVVLPGGYHLFLPSYITHGSA